LQSDLAKQSSSLNNYFSLFSTNYHKSQEKRIKSIEALWLNLLEFKKIIPSEGSFVYNILGEKEIEDYWTRETNNEFYIAGQKSLLSINEADHWKTYYLYAELIDKERPFIGEKIWHFYELYLMFHGRIAVLLLHGRKDRKYKHWHHDDYLKQILETFLSKEEVLHIYNFKINSLKITSAFLEQKLLQEINKSLSGETLTETAIEQINRFDILFKLPT